MPTVLVAPEVRAEKRTTNTRPRRREIPKLTGGRQGRHGPGAAPRRKFEAGASDDGPAVVLVGERRAHASSSRATSTGSHAAADVAHALLLLSSAWRAVETTAAPPTDYMPVDLFK